MNFFSKIRLNYAKDPNLVEHGQFIALKVAVTTQYQLETATVDTVQSIKLPSTANYWSLTALISL